jgi:hypothetical protein
MFLSDAEVEQMTGVVKGKNRPSTLRRWLVDNHMVEGVDFFRRKDGWYSVVRPAQRAVDRHRPKLRLSA